MEKTRKNSKQRLRIGIILGSLALMYLCFLREVNAGGKGKGGRQGHIIIQNEIKDGNNRIVPIYMPIPIPIPMPIGNSDGYRPQHHHQQQQDGEGEVKKIYLLQPMPKINPQLKGGGFVGPVQNHIHLPSPVIPHSNSRQHRPFSQPQKTAQTYDGDTGGLQELEKKPHGGVGMSKSYSSMKILPIVVIPPIAPISPIQINSESRAPRMSLIPQINNYLSSDANRESVFRNQHDRRSHMETYGGSGGGAVFRETLGSRGRMRSRQGSFGSGSRFRARYLDDFNDDYDYGGSPSFQSRSRSNTPMRANRRRMYLDMNGRVNRMNVQDSIRDIIDQQVHFDDDIERQSGGSIRVSDCCGGSRRPMRLPRLIDSASEHVDFREPSTSVNSDLSHQLKSSSSVRDRLQTDSDTEELTELPAENYSPTKSNSDLTYYEHDLPHSFDSTHHRESKTPRRLYLDEHETLNDDEWIFDTIKSIKHVDPDLYGKKAEKTTISNATTIVPPLNTTRIE